MRPSDEAILKVIAEHFGVSINTARMWISDIVKDEQKNEQSA